MKSILTVCSIAIIGIFLNSCRKIEVCESPELVKFRNLEFTFPLSGTKVGEMASGKFEYVAAWIKTDSLLKSERIYWYFDYSDNRNSLTDTTAYLRDCAIYGVTWNLYDEGHKNEKDIIRELKKNYPGEYVYNNRHGTQYYTYNKGCLTIIIQKIASSPPNSTSTVMVPVISFCYGLTGRQIENYANNPGSLFDRD